MRMKVILVVLLGLAPLGSDLPAPAAVVGEASPAAIDIESECRSTDTAVPQQAEPPLVGDYEREVVLDVHVLLVGVDMGGAARIMDQVAGVFSPIGIKVRPTFETVDLEIHPEEDTSATGTVLSTSDSEAYIAASKEHLGGKRPWFADVVYTMVSRELESAVAGQADCVGGIVYPDAAFAVGETGTGTPSLERVSAKIAAHEIAHLLAAHHHFANCVEGNLEEPQYGDACTLMFNDVFFVSLLLSQLEAAVVRSYALDYADDTPTTPPATIERSITLKIGRKRVARGIVASASETEACTSLVDIAIERRNDADGSWTTVEDGSTYEDSTYRFALKDPGTYRVVAPEKELPDMDRCLAAVSPEVTVR